MPIQPYSGGSSWQSAAAEAAAANVAAAAAQAAADQAAAWGSSDSGGSTSSGTSAAAQPKESRYTTIQQNQFRAQWTNPWPPKKKFGPGT
jgi:hypothetical protein